jgi:ribosomal 50S subunit-recycling heat shock protein
LIRLDFLGACKYKKNRSIALNTIQTGIVRMDEEDDFDILYYSVSMREMTKVLTIRTPNLIFNSTVFTYEFRIDDSRQPIVI